MFVPMYSFLTTTKEVEVGGWGGGAVVGLGGAVPGGVERRIYAAPYPAGDAPFRDGVDSGDSDANKDGGGAVVGESSAMGE